MKRLVVFASGNGTNFQAIYEAIQEGKLHCELPLVIVDKENAYCRERAKNCGVDCVYVDPHQYPSKKEYEEEICVILKKYSIDFIALAGYMRLVGDTLLDAYEGRLVNIHPALLPSFKGKEAIDQAFTFGCKIMGITIHYVDKGMDSGKIIDQASFHVEDDDTLESVEAKTHALEHKLYPATLEKLLNQ